MSERDYSFIVFAFDTKTPKSFKNVKRSDGMIFRDKDAADVWIKEAIADEWCDKFIIGRLYFDDFQNGNNSIQIFGVESVGFKIDKHKSLTSTQLDLFKPSN